MLSNKLVNILAVWRYFYSWVFDWSWNKILTSQCPRWGQGNQKVAFRWMPSTTTLPSSRTCTFLGSKKGQPTSSQTPLMLDTNCLYFCLQVGAKNQCWSVNLQKPDLRHNHNKHLATWIVRFSAVQQYKHIYFKNILHVYLLVNTYSICTYCSYLSFISSKADIFILNVCEAKVLFLGCAHNLGL